MNRNENPKQAEDVSEKFKSYKLHYIYLSIPNKEFVKNERYAWKIIWKIH